MSVNALAASKLKYYRKRVENTLADITAKFPEKLRAVASEGLLLKIIIYVVIIILDKQFLITTHLITTQLTLLI